jgi:hypothetical protein
MSPDMLNVLSKVLAYNATYNEKAQYLPILLKQEIKKVLKNATE